MDDALFHLRNGRAVVDLPDDAASVRAMTFRPDGGIDFWTSARTADPDHVRALLLEAADLGFIRDNTTPRAPGDEVDLAVLEIMSVTRGILDDLAIPDREEAWHWWRGAARLSISESYPGDSWTGAWATPRDPEPG